MSTIAKKKNTSYYIHSAITIAIMFLFPLLPNIGSITDVGMHLLGITIGMLYGWIFVELAWPSVFGMLMIGSTGFTTISGAFTSGFGNSTIVTGFMFFAFAMMLDQMKVTDFVANKMLSQKFIIGRPWVLVTMILAIAYVIGALADTIPGTFITWSIALAITDKSGYSRDDKLVAFLLCGIVFSATLGGMLLPFKITSIAFCGFLTAATGLTIDAAKFIIFMGVTTILVLALLLVLAKLVIKLDVSKLETSEESLKVYDVPGTTLQKAGFALLGIFIIMLLIPSFMPKTIPAVAMLKNWGTIGCLAVVILIPAILRDENGNAIVSISTMMKGTGWDIIWLLIATVVAASGLSSADTGIMTTVSQFVMPLIHEMSPTVLMIIASLIVCIITQFIHNFIVGAMFIPFVIPICISAGGNPILCFFFLYWGLMLAFATPAASMTSAFMHGHENVTPKDAYGYGSLYMVIGLLTTFAVGIPLGSILF